LIEDFLRKPAADRLAEGTMTKLATKKIDLFGNRQSIVDFCSRYRSIFLGVHGRHSGGRTMKSSSSRGGGTKAFGALAAAGVVSGLLSVTASADQPKAPAAAPSSSPRAAQAQPLTGNVDLAITSEGSGSPTGEAVVAGGLLVSKFTVSNTSSTDLATNVVVTHFREPGTTFVTSSFAQPQETGTCTTVVPQTIDTCTIQDLPAGRSTSLIITVRISANLLSSRSASATSITEEVFVKADQVDPQNDNNSAITTTLVTESADMALTKTCKPDTPAQAGTSAFCEILVANLGVSDAQNVVVSDVIVSNARFAVTSLVGSSTGCSVLAGLPGPPGSATIECKFATVVAGGGGQRPHRLH
jgi:uncharacterized repeat protein (TIGR01451 family)